MIAERLPATLELMASSFVLAALAGPAPRVSASALRPHGPWIDLLGTGASFLGIAMPVFWLGLLLQMVVRGAARLASRLRARTPWGPRRSRPPGAPGPARDRAVARATSPRWSRYLRGSLLGVLGADYVRTARAQGPARSGASSAFTPCATP